MEIYNSAPNAYNDKINYQILEHYLNGVAFLNSKGFIVKKIVCDPKKHDEGKYINNSVYGGIGLFPKERLTQGSKFYTVFYTGEGYSTNRYVIKAYKIVHVDRENKICWKTLSEMRYVRGKYLKNRLNKVFGTEIFQEKKKRNKEDEVRTLYQRIHNLEKKIEKLDEEKENLMRSMFKDIKTMILKESKNIQESIKISEWKIKEKLND